jgi:hypothetical protein
LSIKLGDGTNGLKDDSFTRETRNIINVNDGLLNLNTEKLYKEYCTGTFEENSVMKYENMHNDFKIILKLLESLKNEINNGETTLNKPINNVIDLLK